MKLPALRIHSYILLVLLLATPSYTSAAILYIDPPTGTYGVGDTFISNVRIDNQKQCINAAHIEVRYPAQILKAVDFSKGGSIFSLWVEGPTLNTDEGKVVFSGGIPGGYCGRIQGDPLLSNILGKIVFTVISANAASAEIAPSQETSAVYLHDGQATPAEISVQSATIAISSEAQQTENPWLQSIEEDTTPPDKFQVLVESTRGVFGGKYYAVFSTVDKQSGIDHYEIFERGAWKTVTSPHELKDQYLRGAVQVKAIDKAGNERLADFIPESVGPRVAEPADYTIGIIVVLALLALGAYFWIRDRRRTPEQGEP